MEILLNDFRSDLQKEQEGIVKTLDEMKVTGKEKTVRCREMLGQKLINKALLERIEKYIEKNAR